MTSEAVDLTGEYIFGAYRLTLRPHRALRGSEPIRLPRRALMVLTVLLQRSGGIVSKEELFNIVWRDIVVEPNNLGVQISTLRRIFGRELIETVPGHGYKISVEVELSGRLLPASGNPPLRRQAGSETTNLPNHLNPIIGRDVEQAVLARRIRQERIVTLAGPGGVGKTRLAIELGRQLARDFVDGVWLIDLAPLTDPALVASATATVLGVVLGNTQTPIETIVAAIAKRRLLLIFDNCEYLVAAVAELIEALLDRVDGVTVLVTSQEVLRLSTETDYWLDPLALPPETGDGRHDADIIARYGAIELFVARARAADRRFRLEEGNAALVTAICRGLEGMPLALEMAAARATTLGIRALNQHLGDRLALLSARSRTGDARHRTLLGMVEWSYGLLCPADQQVFRRLTIFRGGFSLDAAIAVAGTDEVTPWATVEALQRLIDKSLVTVDPGEAPRYRLLETLRLFAAKQLNASGESDAIAERHAGYFIRFFDGADDAQEAISDLEWRAIYAPEIDNVRAALDWAMADPARKQKVIAMTAVAAIIWDRLSLFGEGKSYFDRAEGFVDRNTPDSVMAPLLRWGGNFWIERNRPRGLALLERAVTIYRRLHRPLRLGDALGQMGVNYTYYGRYAEAQAALGEAEEILSTGGCTKALSYVMAYLGVLASNIDNAAEARRCYGRALELSRTVNDLSREGYSLFSLAEFEFKIGEMDAAVERAREAVSAFRATQHRHLLGAALNNFASYLVSQDSLIEARSAAEESLSLVIEYGGFAIAAHLQLWAVLAAVEGGYEEAARLAGYVDAGYVALGANRDTTEQFLHIRLSKLLAENLSPAVIRSYAAEGARWSEDQAMSFVHYHIVSRRRLG